MVVPAPESQMIRHFSEFGRPTGAALPAISSTYSWLAWFFVR